MTAKGCSSRPESSRTNGWWRSRTIRWYLVHESYPSEEATQSREEHASAEVGVGDARVDEPGHQDCGEDWASTEGEEATKLGFLFLQRDIHKFDGEEPEQNLHQIGKAHAHTEAPFLINLAECWDPHTDSVKESEGVRIPLLIEHHAGADDDIAKALSQE